MALQASFSSSSSSFSYEWSYDVFLSFRGFDTRHGFTGNLYKALCDRGIRTFIDDEELQRGEEIAPSLVKAIQESRIAIPVFSKNYASSSFCLDELVIIMEYIKGKGRLVLPVFYDVDPCDVRHQRGSYGEAMAKHEKRFKDIKEKVQKWRKALSEAANLSGEDLKLGNEYEYVFIEKIVKEISKKISRVPLHVADYPVGLESRVLEVNSLLDDGYDGGVLMVGIYGTGGIGKTTLARAVYNLIADQFEDLCFLENVRENSTKHGLIHLQEMLLSEILGKNYIKLGSIYQGIPIIKSRLCQKKVLLVLDDVDKFEQLQALFGGPSWFGSGSKIIITTRDKHLLASHGIERKYEVMGLWNKEALALLSWNAFKHENVDPSYLGILNYAVTYAGGLPLGLEVIGSNFFDKTIEEWKSGLDQYKRIPNKRIQNILKISFDALEEYQQKIFLDIACYFKGNNWAEVEDILYARHDVCLNYGLRVLAEKSLIKIYSYRRVMVHDLILDMGKEIVRQESPKKPGKRSRLWLPKDIVQVLEQNIGTSDIEIIILDAPISEEVVVKWDGDAFKKMTNLETLIIRNACFSQGAKHLPNSLRMLEWWNYPSNSLPYDFYPKKLAIFKLPWSNLMQVRFIEKRKFMNFRVLNLDRSNIEQIPNVSGAPNLKKLSFEHCRNLIKVHESVGFLNKLCFLSAVGCEKLRSFPALMLPSLKNLNLSWCTNLETFPKILGEMAGIEEICWFATSIKEFPSSITNLTTLRILTTTLCGMLRLRGSNIALPSPEQVFGGFDRVLQFPKQDQGEEQGSSTVSSIVECINFRGCNMSDEFVPVVLAWFRNVVTLDLSENNFTFLPVSIKELCSLKTLTLDNCKILTEIRGIPPNIKSLSAINCTSLTSLTRSMLLKKELHKDGDKMFHLPGSSIPKWFEHRSKQNSISFWFRNKFPPVAACVVGGPIKLIKFYYGKLFGFELITNGFSSFFWARAPFVEADHIITLDEQIKPSCEVDKVILENEWNHVVCRVRSIEGLVIKKFGIHVLKHKSNMEDIRFTDPLLQKEEVNMGDFQRNMQPQKNLASLGLLETQQGKWLSLRLPPAMNLLNDYVNSDSNSITLMQISSSTGVQGSAALSKDKGKDLMVYNHSSEQISINSCRQELLDKNSKSNSIKLASTSGTIREGPCYENLYTLKLGLDYEAIELSCHEHSNVDSDSDSTMSSSPSDNDQEGGSDDNSWMYDMELLSLGPCWEETMACENYESNLMQLASTSDTTNDQGNTALSKDKGKDLMVYNHSSEQISMHSCLQELLDKNSESNSIKLASTSDTIREGSCYVNLCTLKLGFDYEAIERSCHAHSNVDSDSDSTMSSLASDSDREGGSDDDSWMYDMELLPRRPYWGESLDCENYESNLMQLASTSDTINDQVTKSTPINALGEVPQEEEEDWSDKEGEEEDKVAEQQEEVPQEEPEDRSDGEGEEKDKAAEQQEEVPEEEPKCRRSKRKAPSEGVSKPAKSRKASLVTTEPINISFPTGSINEAKVSLKPRKRKSETSTTTSSKDTSAQLWENLVKEKETNAHLSHQFEEVLLDPVLAAAKASSRLGKMKSTKEGFSRQSRVQVESHVSDPLSFIQDPSQDPELLSTIDRTKNKENQDKTMAAVDSALFDLSDPFLRDFNDFGKDLVGDNVEQALNDMGGDDLFAQLDKILLGEGPTLAIYSSKAPSVGFSTQAENVPSISLLVECFELLKDKDLDSLATDKDLMDSLMEKLAHLGAMVSQLPPQFKHPTLKLQRFYKDTFDQFMPAREALERHRQLIESKSKLLKDLEGLKKRRVGLANFDEVTTQKVGLEELNKLALKESKLLEYKERSEAALDALKIELSSKLIEFKKLSSELIEAESEAKKAKEIKESLSKQLKDVQQSLKVAKF